MPDILTYQTMAAPEGGTSNVAPEGPPVANARVNTGPISINADGSSVIHGPRSINTADFGSPVSSGILSTARTKLGAPVMGDIKPTDVITVNGMEMQASIAEQLGMLTRDQSGRYAERDGGVEAASQAPEQAPADDGAVQFASEHAEQNFASLITSTQPGSQVAAMAELIETGAVSDRTLNRAATEASKEPGEMAQRVEMVKVAFKAQADASVASHGVEDANGLWEWARQNRPNDLKHAMNQHGLTRDPKVYGNLAREYVASVADHSPASVLNAQFGGGITASEVRGQVVLNIPGKGQMPFRTALKQGFIKVSGL